MPGKTRGDFQEPTGGARLRDTVAASRDGVRMLAGVGRIGLCGRFTEISRHRHAAPALVIGVDRPLRFVAERTHESRAVLIDPGFAHAVDTGGGRLAMFVLLPHARRAGGAPIRDLARPGDWVALGEALFREQLTDFSEVDHALSGEPLPAEPIDDRLHSALATLAGTLDANLPIEEVAAVARLSPSRLMALVHDQLGTSLRAYRRWLRAFQVARDFAAGASLTEAALGAGFSSSAHLSAAARDHFGIRPSDILNARNRTAIRSL